MISSSNFFKKTFFPEHQLPPTNHKFIGPWLQQEQLTLSPTSHHSDFINHHRFRTIKAKRQQQEIYLPVINANLKLFQIGDLSAFKSTKHAPRHSRYHSIDSKIEPIVRKSLEPRNINEMAKRVKRRSQSPVESSISKAMSSIGNYNSSTKNNNKLEGGIFRVVGIPTSNLFL